jgi:hypothetical protein
MNRQVLLTVIAAAAIAIPAGAQQHRRANLTSGWNGDGGRCFAEVVVDGAAELQIQGDSANLRNLSGGQPQWRRFDCTSPMPGNADVRVNINGRGRAQLIASPRNGGPAVVRIEDSKSGATVYQLEFQWAGGFGNQARGSWAPSQAIENCRQAVRQEARSRFGSNNVQFRQINVDDNPGRQDWVVGTLSVRRGRNEDLYPFSCSLNLNNGRVRQAQIESRQNYAGRDVEARVMDTCRAAVVGRIGNERLDFGPMNIEDRAGDDLVHGTARGRARAYQFTCSVNPYSGSVRRVDVR